MRLTEEQEETRLRGLRILARMIVRHHMANIGPYPNGSAGGVPAPSTVDGKSFEREEAA